MPGFGRMWWRWAVTDLQPSYRFFFLAPFIYNKNSKYIWDRLVSFRKDSSQNPSLSNTTLRHSNIRSTPLKLIYIISGIINQKSSVLDIFFTHLSSGVKWTTKSSELLRSIFLDIQILDPTIWSWSKHLKTLTNLLGFKCSTPLN